MIESLSLLNKWDNFILISLNKLLSNFLEWQHPLN